MVCCRSCRVLPQPHQLDPGVVEAAIRLGRHLYLCLQEFASNMAHGAEIGGVKKSLRSLRGRLEGAGIGKEIFLFDAELESFIVRKRSVPPVRPE